MQNKRGFFLINQYNLLEFNKNTTCFLRRDYNFASKKL